MLRWEENEEGPGDPVEAGLWDQGTGEGRDVLSREFNTRSAEWRMNGDID